MMTTRGSISLAIDKSRTFYPPYSTKGLSRSRDLSETAEELSFGPFLSALHHTSNIRIQWNQKKPTTPMQLYTYLKTRYNYSRADKHRPEQ